MGFSIEEEMSGSHEFEKGCGPEGQLPLSFRVKWGALDIVSWARPGSDEFLLNDLEGSISVEGLCQDCPCKGDLQLRYFKDRKIRYSFDFTVGDIEYRYVGEKVNIRLWNLATSHTTCFGLITEKDSGKLISRSVVHFKLRSLLPFLMSLSISGA